ncbi:MAG: MFS transporter [Eggerthellaceae bacterium]|jgi:MFS family permease|nr:MFS transporter [Eggerthellaceae bacterium]
MRQHYRIVIVACCFCILFINQGLPATSFNVFQSYLVAMPGVGDLGGSLVLTVRSFVSLVAIFFVSAFYRRFSLRVGVAAATAFTAAGFLAYSLARDLALLCLGSVLTGIGYGFGGVVATTMLIGNWYRGHIGTVAGAVGMGSGVASMVMPLAVAAVIARSDLSHAFLMEALLALGLGTVVVALLRSKPQDVGLRPVEEPAPAAPRAAGTSPAAPAPAAPPAAAAPTRTAPEPSAPAAPARHPGKVHVGAATLPRADKRLMLAAMVLLGAVAIVGNGYFSVLLTSSGIGLETAALLTAVLGTSLTLSKLACGWVFDLAGARKGSLAFFTVLIVGLLLCSLAGPGGAADGFFAAVFFGVGVALATTGVSVWTLELSAPRDRLGMVRDFQVAYAFGGFAFNLMPGALANATGSYAVSYALFAAAAIACALIVGIVYKRRNLREALPLS